MYPLSWRQGICWRISILTVLHPGKVKGWTICTKGERSHVQLLSTIYMEYCLVHWPCLGLNSSVLQQLLLQSLRFPIADYQGFWKGSRRFTVAGVKNRMEKSVQQVGFLTTICDIRLSVSQKIWTLAWSCLRFHLWPETFMVFENTIFHLVCMFDLLFSDKDLGFTMQLFELCDSFWTLWIQTKVLIARWEFEWGQSCTYLNFI